MGNYGGTADSTIQIVGGIKLWLTKKIWYLAFICRDYDYSLVHYITITMATRLPNGGKHEDGNNYSSLYG